jgi:hypothetical protein
MQATGEAAARADVSNLDTSNDVDALCELEGFFLLEGRETPAEEPLPATRECESESHGAAPRPFPLSKGQWLRLPRRVLFAARVGESTGMVEGGGGVSGLIAVCGYCSSGEEVEEVAKDTEDLLGMRIVKVLEMEGAADEKRGLAGECGRAQSATVDGSMARLRYIVELVALLVLVVGIVCGILNSVGLELT